MTTFTYFSNQERPAIKLEWLDGTGAVINFSSGYTFSAKLVGPITDDATKNTVAATEVTGVAGAATSPNVTVTWTDVSLAALDGTYKLVVYATTGGKDNVFNPADPPLVRVIPAAT